MNCGTNGCLICLVQKERVSCLVLSNLPGVVQLNSWLTKHKQERLPEWLVGLECCVTWRNKFGIATNVAFAHCFFRRELVDLETFSKHVSNQRYRNEPKSREISSSRVHWIKCVTCANDNL